jgi:2-amino-4-hydroxy-6-hydroxymethyldihydropteridine diphosphokinase
LALTRVAIGLGTNLGDRSANLDEALKRLAEPVRLLAVSEPEETAPMYETGQPAFLNQVALGETALGPFSLLRALKQIEFSMGREPGPRNGPRLIDLDIVVYGRLRLNSDQLELPHPRAHERPFVMQPLAKLAPDLAVWLAHSPQSAR